VRAKHRPGVSCPDFGQVRFASCPISPAPIHWLFSSFQLLVVKQHVICLFFTMLQDFYFSFLISKVEKMK